MSEHLPQPPETSLHERHEPTDIAIGGVLKLLVILFAILGLSLYLLVWLFTRYAAEARLSDPHISPLADVEQSPPEPRLRATPSLEYQRHREAQQAELETEGVIDKQRKIVRIPISRAMDLLVERGLPKTKPRQLDGETPAKESDGAQDAESESSTPGAQEPEAAPEEDATPEESRDAPPRRSGREPRRRQPPPDENEKNPRGAAVEEGRAE